MGLDIHGILQIRENNYEWVTIDTPFRWIDSGDRNRELFEELMDEGDMVDDLNTILELTEKLKKEYRFDTFEKLRGIECFGIRKLTLAQIQALKWKEEPEYSCEYRFLTELEEIYPGDPHNLRIVYCFDN